MQAPNNVLQHIIGLITNATRTQDAAQATVEWLGAYLTQAAVYLSKSRLIFTAPDYTLEDEVMTWLQTSVDWHGWTEPRQIAADEQVDTVTFESATLMLPLHYKGTSYGMLCLDGDIPERGQVTLLAALLAGRIHYLDSPMESLGDAPVELAVNTDILDQATLRARALAAVNEISTILTRNAAGHAIWEPLHHQLIYLFDTTSLFVGIYDRQRDVLNLPLVSENGLRQLHADSIDLAGLSAAVVQHGQPLHFRDVMLERERLISLNTFPDDREPGYGALSWMGVPLRDRHMQITGLIAIQNDLPESYDDDDLALLTTIAAQLSLALDNAALLDAEQERHRVASTLMDVGRVVSSTLQTTELFERIIEQIARLLNFDNVAVLMPIEGDVLLPGEDGQIRLVISANKGLRLGTQSSRLSFGSETLVSRVILSQQPLVVHDLDVYEYAGWSVVDPKTRSWLAVPMLVQDRVVGLITVGKLHPGYYNDEDATNMLALARQAAIAVENAGLLARSEENLREVQERARRLSVINRLGTMTSSTLERDSVLHSAVELLVEIFGVRHASIVLLDDFNQMCSIVAEYPHHHTLLQQFERDSVPLLDDLFNSQTVQIINDAAQRREELPEVLLIEPEAVQRLMLVPLIARNQMIGCLSLDSYDENHSFTENDSSLAMTVSIQIAIAISNATLYDEAVEANRLKSEFLANISHELRTPLNPIIGYTDLMLDGMYGDLTDKQTDRLQSVNDSAQHLLAVINDLFDLSMLEAGQMELDMSLFPLMEVIQPVITMAQQDTEAKGLNFESTIAETLPLLRGDTQRITQAVKNLLDNAIKFTREGSVSISIQAHTVSEGAIDGLTIPDNISVPDGKWLSLTVADTGIGITEQDQRIIFDAFRQADGSSIREFEGTGLGLAITQRLILMHNGHIWVDSVPGEGTTFTLLLPDAKHNEKVATEGD